MYKHVYTVKKKKNSKSIKKKSKVYNQAIIYFILFYNR